MSDLAAPVTATPAAMPTTRLTVTDPAPAHHSFFREFLSELNPLQYVPVLGTIYRAVTGDTIPELARDAGSLVVSGLTGGPVGVALNLGMLAAEKITGIDPEKIGDSVLAGVGIGIGIGNGGTSKPASPTITALSSATLKPAELPATAWSSAQLSAYGVTQNAKGEIQRGGLTGSDVLNELELARHSAPIVA